jgi:predicted nucleic acid-binding protein
LRETQRSRNQPVHPRNAGTSLGKSKVATNSGSNSHHGDRAGDGPQIAADTFFPRRWLWTQTGKTLARFAEKRGRGRLTNDALIAMSAARLGIAVITAKMRDFMRFAEFRPFQRKVHEFRSSE